MKNNTDILAEFRVKFNPVLDPDARNGVVEEWLQAKLTERDELWKEKMKQANNNGYIDKMAMGEIIKTERDTHWKSVLAEMPLEDRAANHTDYIRTLGYNQAIEAIRGWRDQILTK